MAKRPFPQLNVTISHLNMAGMGIATHEGRQIEVGNCLPGDTVDIQVFGKKAGVWKARTLSRISATLPRQTGHCSVAGLCGGCRFPDLSYATQLAMKQGSLDTFLGPLKSLQKAPILPAIETRFHRNKMDYVFGYAKNIEGFEGAIAPSNPLASPEESENGIQRTEPFETPCLKSASTTLILGLKKRGDFRTIVPTTDCQLLDHTANDILADTLDFFRERNFLAWPNSHTPTEEDPVYLRYLTLRHSKTTGKFLITLVVNRMDPCFTEWANRIAAKFPMSGVLAGIHAGSADTSTPGAYIVLSGDAYLEENLLGTTFRLSPGAFFQTSTKQAEILYKEVLHAGAFTPDQRVLDLYSGTGTIGMLIAPHVREVIGIEEHPGAIKDAQANADANGIRNISFIEGRVRNILKFNALEADTIVIDPPRSGLEPKVITRIAARAPKRIVYVSCQPTTWKRDIADFATHGYALTSLQAVDMFPHTPHLEIVSVLEHITISSLPIA
jgi:23S rRNA (uracil1939-C5)-methyltransferase